MSCRHHHHQPQQLLSRVRLPSWRNKNKATMSKPYLLLESQNRALAHTLQKIIQTPTPDFFAKFADFDGAVHTVSTQDPSIITVALTLSSLPALLPLGTEEFLREEYGALIESIQRDTVKLRVNVSDLPCPQDELIEKVASLKCNVISGPIRKVAAACAKNEAVDAIEVPYRSDECFWILPKQGAFSVCYGIRFTEELDLPLARVFMQEFQDAKRHIARSTVPNSSFTTNVPGGLAPFRVPTDYHGFVEIAVTARHYSTPELAKNLFGQLSLFRGYLHYHIKCTKAYIHQRMRNTFRALYQTLNRARPEAQSAKKPARR
eukprot:gnl/Trimastix_PCT/503.p1 GENE.gnl/Trimastix_PCT/503~~gnl/Trimastix_PCT/503.p1  ORF type:complete len:319 (-),score=71.53 gnl/Trimastix_PCT/503:127-1083(-)